MATGQEAIDSDSSDSNEMKIVEPTNDIDPPAPPPLPSSSFSQSSQSPPPQQQSQPSPSSSQPLQILDALTPEDSSSTATDTNTQQPQQKAPESTNNKPQETSFTAINSDNNPISSEPTIKTDDQTASLNNSTPADDIEMMPDTENDVITNHNISTKSETKVPFESKSSGKKRSIDQVTHSPSEVTTESAEKKLVSCKKESKQEKDNYCWICHKEKSHISCKSCPRSYHFKCLPTENSGPNDNSEPGKSSANTVLICGNDDWVCPECSTIKKSENVIKSTALGHLNPHEFSELLMFAVQTVKANADRSFHQPVSEVVFPDYRQFVVHPMDFSTIERNIRSKAYSCPDALLADIKYIVHNCYIYNSSNHPLTKNANYFLKVAKTEIQEIEICPNCCRNFYTFKDKEWFTEPCARPHILVYAKMRGYPPWPAKVVRYDKEKNEVDVRFFGAHDRSWVPVDQCCLLTKPNATKNSKGSGKGQKNSKYDSALNELALHIKRLNELFPFKFHYAKTKQPIDVNKLYICDGNEDEEVSSMDDDRDSDLNEDKLVIDETGDDLDTTTASGATAANESVEVKEEKNYISSDSTTSQPNAPDSLLTESKVPIPKLTIPKSIKVPIRSPQSQSQQSNSSPKKEETPKVTKRKGKTKKEKAAEQEKLKEKEKVEIAKTPPSSKKLDAKKKSAIRSVEEESNKTLEELEALQKKYEFEKILHREQLKEIEHNHDLKIREMRESWFKENERALKELQSTLEEKYRKEIEETKKKLWCSECLREAMYFCCWNTSYCSLECQKAQWPKHAAKCQQQSHWQQTNSQSSASQQQNHQNQPQPQQQQQQQPQLQSATVNNNTSSVSYSSTLNQQI